MAEGAAFVRRLRAGSWLRGEAFAYVLVPELHKDGHVHLHLALDRFVGKSHLSDVWGHGFIDVRKISSGDGGRASARDAAGYLTKYLSKTFEEDETGETMAGRHRYEVAEGFQPEKVKRAGYGSREQAFADLVDSYALSIYGEPVWSEEVDPEGVLWAWMMVEPLPKSTRAGPG